MIALLGIKRRYRMDYRVGLLCGKTIFLGCTPRFLMMDGQNWRGRLKGLMLGRNCADRLEVDFDGTLPKYQTP